MWSQIEEKEWQDEYAKIKNLTKYQKSLVSWLSSLPWTHIYHQTFRAEITDGGSALSLGSRFLAEYSSCSTTTAALLVSERHPKRKERMPPPRFLRSARHYKHLDSGTGEPSGRQGRLYHMHGLLAGPSRSLSAGRRELSRGRERSRSKTGSRSKEICEPYWRSLKEAAWKSLGAARIWRITTTKEIAATVYAIKYILKGQHRYPETEEHRHPMNRSAIPLKWQAGVSRDDWTICRFSA